MFLQVSYTADTPGLQTTCQVQRTLPLQQSEPSPDRPRILWMGRELGGEGLRGFCGRCGRWLVGLRVSNFSLNNKIDDLA
jgi:hypothetical protein